MGVRVAVAHVAGRPSAITSSSAIVDVGAPAKALLGKAQRRCAPKAAALSRTLKFKVRGSDAALGGTGLRSDVDPVALR